MNFHYLLQHTGFYLSDSFGANLEECLLRHYIEVFFIKILWLSVSKAFHKFIYIASGIFVVYTFWDFI